MTLELEPLTITEPGVYDGIPDDVYHADPVPGGSLSTSGAKVLVQKSPAHYKWDRENRRPDKAAFDFGHAAHAEVLGEGLDVVVVEGNWATKAAKEAVQEARSAGKVPLHPEEYERVLGMAEAIREHPLAPLLLSNGKPEQSAFWQDAPTKVWRRARFDWLPGITSGQGRLIIPDYKTARSSEPVAFGKAAADYGYAMQADAYTEAARVLGLHPEPAFVFLVQEKEPPYVVTTVQLDADAMQIGRYLNRKALDIYAECSRTDTWPGYSDEVVSVSLPGWYVNNHPEAFQ